MKANNFDKVAFIYDGLSRLVFGRSIVGSQKYFLNQVKKGSRVLILGGGTGWILQELFKTQREVIVCYIDASEKMIASAKEKTGDDGWVQFITGTENDIPEGIKFDFVITNFYLDLFTDVSVKAAIDKIMKSLSPNAQWIATDFVNQSFWQSVMLRVMYFFFRVTCNIESRKLPRWQNALLQAGAKQEASKKFYNGFIETTIYQL